MKNNTREDYSRIFDAYRTGGMAAALNASLQSASASAAIFELPINDIGDLLMRSDPFYAAVDAVKQICPASWALSVRRFRAPFTNVLLLSAYPRQGEGGKAFLLFCTQQMIDEITA